MSDIPVAGKLFSHKGSILILLQYVLFISLILYFGRDVFVPIAFATLISFILHPICSWMERKGVGRVTAIAISITLLMLLVISVIALLTEQFFAFTKELPTLEVKIAESINRLSDYFIQSYGISREQQLGWIDQAGDQAVSSFIVLLKGAISTSAFSMVMLILIPIYSVLILYYKRIWVEVLCRIFPEEGRESILEILSLTIQTYYNFIKGMGLVYLIVGILNSVGLLLLGVPHAILFGCIASILTFVPYIGIMVGSLLPITIAWATYDSVWYPLGIIAIFGFVQYLEANVIFPWAVSSRLNVNTMVVLIAIFVGGLLWGLAGMILFVPFVGIVMLIANHNPRLKTLALALGTGTE